MRDESKELEVNQIDKEDEPTNGAVQEEEIEEENESPCTTIREMVENKNPPVLVADYLRSDSSLSGIVP